MVLDPALKHHDAEGSANNGLGDSVSELLPEFLTSEKEVGVDADLENILIWAQTRFGNDDIVQAKEEFFWKTGKVFHDDPFYEQRMNYFLDYFLLERPGRDSGDKGGTIMTPIEAFKAVAGHQLSIETATHSVFEIKKILSDSVMVIDLISNTRLEIGARKGESFKLLSKKQIFQGFLYDGGDRVILSRGVIFHPERANKAINKMIKTIRKNKDISTQRLLSTLAKHHLRFLRHSNLDPKRIYAEL